MLSKQRDVVLRESVIEIIVYLMSDQRAVFSMDKNRTNLSNIHREVFHIKLDFYCTLLFFFFK